MDPSTPTSCLQNWSVTGKSFMIPRCAKHQYRNWHKIILPPKVVGQCKTPIRAGELTEDKEVHIFTSRQMSHQHRIPRNKIVVNGVDNKLHEELKQLEKIQDWCIFWTYLKSLEHSKT
uniref:Uncharacterized protein n=1 Tax=Athene cunicularia TaxID=194338 RepID=A0A663N3B8_ATHCN